MKTQGFRHIGEVVKVDSGDVVTISLRSVEACDGCRAKSVCSVSGGKSESGEQREMRVVSRLAGSLSVGERVDVSITYRVGMMAIVVAYVIPLFVFICALVGGVMAGIEQGVVALVSFGVMALYYICVYIFRERFERVVNFELFKIE